MVRVFVTGPCVQFKLSPWNGSSWMFAIVADAVVHVVGSDTASNQTNTIAPSSLVSVVLREGLSITDSLNAGLVHVTVAD